ncbi:MAG: hypothetical protein JWO59_70, partial [Chloroflexi bacterium]|nr:hypothetical protein [Chloroflexota bacterium]
MKILRSRFLAAGALVALMIVGLPGAATAPSQRPTGRARAADGRF